MTTIGFIGSGNIGGTLAKLFADAGYDVVISNSRGPETLADEVAEIGDHARAATAAEAAEAGEVVVVSVPFLAVDQVPVTPLAGKVVIDTNNYYFERDGHVAAIDDGQTTPSEVLQEHLPESHVVKLFNAIQAGHLATQGVPAGTPARRALPMAGDDETAKATVARLADEIGYDVVDVGALAEGWRFDRDQPAYGAAVDAAGLRALLDDAKRASTSA
ncbi:coenzyme F420-dependent NADP oxidoreductase [Nocardioides sp. PD653]|nr:coenzyme F420-dependent NADP oxidoreductase [Nocardioides sp. PD653-B2]GAW57133.1 coenzyme F420-dependent NADP oxidoreductase [Nocardioides sp. PD653]